MNLFDFSNAACLATLFLVGCGTILGLLIAGAGGPEPPPVAPVVIIQERPAGGCGTALVLLLLIGLIATLLVLSGSVRVTAGP
jgi:hypothetical protein